MIPGDIQQHELDQRFKPLQSQALSDLDLEGFLPDEIHFAKWLDIRYVGQSYELSIPFRKEFIDTFHQSHLQAYAHADPTAPTEIVNLRLRATGNLPTPKLQASPVKTNGPPVQVGAGQCISRKGIEEHYRLAEIPIYNGEKLISGQQIVGPAIIIKSDTTIYLQTGDQAVLDAFRNIIISTG
jgi:N-methylhydantoinase A